MKLTKVFAALLFSCTAVSFALEVNRTELQTAGMDTVVFENYAGPYSVINTIDEIRAIGSRLAPPIAANPEKSMTSGDPSRYYVIHAVDPNESGKLDADIFILGPNVGVDHINNVRRIISAYLSAAYDYSRADADTIATFVSVYNAVYRGNLDAYKQKYKAAVTQHLTADKAGIALSYREWAGKTQIVIPLSDLSGGLSTVETSTISDKDVIRSMQEDDDKGIDARKGMVDLKDREADIADAKAGDLQGEADSEAAKAAAAQAEADKKKAEAEAEAARAKAEAEKAAAAKAEADKKKAEAAQKQAEAAAAQKDAAKKQADANAAAKNAAKNPNDEKAKADAEAAKKDAAEAKKDAAEAKSDADAAKKDADAAKKDADAAKKEADAAQKEADAAKKDADSEQAKADEAQKAADEAQKKADEEQAKADQKRSEAQDERAAIAKDQQEVIERNARNENAPSVYGLKAVDDAGQFACLVRVNIQTGEVIKESPVSSIRGRATYAVGDNFIAIAGENKGLGAVKLILLDKQSMEIIKESNELISDASPLVEADGSYYCVIQEGTSFVLGKFNSDLQNQLKSKITVKPSTPITVSADGILVTGSDGKPALLKLADLSKL